MQDRDQLRKPGRPKGCYPVNETLERLRRGEFVFGISLTELRSITLPRMFANAGFDFLFFDMEHSADGFESTCDLMWSARSSGITPIARVPDPDRFFFSRILDAGAQGIIVPRIEKVEQIEAVVSFSRYPPEGSRGVAFGGRHVDFQPVTNPRQAMAEANREVLVGIQIETLAGLTRVEELVALPGIDLVFIGPQDLSVALNTPSQFDSPEMDEAIARILAAAQSQGLPVGIQGRNIELSRRWMELGINFVVYGSALLLIMQAANQGMTQLRQAAEQIDAATQHELVHGRTNGKSD